MEKQTNNSFIDTDSQDHSVAGMITGGPDEVSPVYLQYGPQIVGGALFVAIMSGLLLGFDVLGLASSSFFFLSAAVFFLIPISLAVAAVVGTLWYRTYREGRSIAVHKVEEAPEGNKSVSITPIEAAKPAVAANIAPQMTATPATTVVASSPATVKPTAIVSNRPFGVRTTGSVLSGGRKEPPYLLIGFTVLMIGIPGFVSVLTGQFDMSLRSLFSLSGLQSLITMWPTVFISIFAIPVAVSYGVYDRRLVKSHTARRMNKLFWSTVVLAFLVVFLRATL